MNGLNLDHNGQPIIDHLYFFPDLHLFQVKQHLCPILSSSDVGRVDILIEFLAKWFPIKIDLLLINFHNEACSEEVVHEFLSEFLELDDGESVIVEAHTFLLCELFVNKIGYLGLN